MLKRAGPKIDIIYNTTFLCPWNCKICCVDAVHVKRNQSQLVLNSNGLSQEEVFAINNNHPNIYEQANYIQTQRGDTCGLKDKLKIIEHLDGYNVKLDISGGDPLIVSDNVTLLQYASKKLGRKNVTLTATAASIAKININKIAPYIGEFNFTFDTDLLQNTPYRPNGYALGNLNVAKKFVAAGCSTRAELPITKSILDENCLSRIYAILNTAKVSKLLLMRLFPVGRGKLLTSNIPTKKEYLFAINVMQKQEKKYGCQPALHLQCALKHLQPPSLKKEIDNPCDMVKHSFGLTPSGDLLASPWAYGLNGKAISNTWVLGNLIDEPLSVILKKRKTLLYLKMADKNFGHCKIFSYLFSKKTEDFARIFDTTDPLYK